jgi:phosphohistidine phosphatase
MQVYIFRHALADFKSASMGGDPPITKEGAAEAERVIELAQSMGFMPNALVTSPLVRAKQTAELTKAKLHSKPELVVDECLYGDRKPIDVLKFLGSYRKDDRVALISHMPLLAELLYSMIGGKVAVEQLNGSIAAVTFEDKALEGKGKLTWLVQPGV